VGANIIVIIAFLCVLSVAARTGADKIKI